MTHREIEWSRFKVVWRRLCKRWSRPVSGDEAMMYWRWLSARMDTDEFVAAAERLWATREFFPPPAAFLVVAAERAWEDVVDLSEFKAFGTSEDIVGELAARKNGLAPAARRALDAAGGLMELRNAIARDAPRARRTFLELYEAGEVGAGPVAGLAEPERVKSVEAPRGGGWTRAAAPATQALSAGRPPNTGASEAP